jgi:hypothetical protein
VLAKLTGHAVVVKMGSRRSNIAQVGEWEPLSHARRAPMSLAPCHRLPRSVATLLTHLHRLPTPSCQDLLSPEATVTGVAIVGVNVEWRCRRTTVGLNWSAGLISEEVDDAGTQTLATGEGEGEESTWTHGPPQLLDGGGVLDFP